MDNDLISRSEVEKLGATCLAKRNENGQLEAIISLDHAPTVQPVYFPPCEDCNKKMEEIRQAYDKMKAMERPQGEWIIEHDWVHCSSCGHEQNYPSKFCPNCGADMRGNINETN